MPQDARQDDPVVSSIVGRMSPREEDAAPEDGESISPALEMEAEDVISALHPPEGQKPDKRKVASAMRRFVQAAMRDIEIEGD